MLGRDLTKVSQCCKVGSGGGARAGLPSCFSWVSKCSDMSPEGLLLPRGLWEAAAFLHTHTRTHFTLKKKLFCCAGCDMTVDSVRCVFPCRQLPLYVGEATSNGGTGHGPHCWKRCFGKHMWDETCLETQRLGWNWEQKGGSCWEVTESGKISFVMSCCRKNLLRWSNKGESPCNKTSLLHRDVAVHIKINV